MRFDVVTTGPDESGFFTATVVSMGFIVARELRRCPARAKRAAMLVLADCDDVTEMHATEWQRTDVRDTETSR